MHALIHRALTPQTIACAWLGVTVALALALAVAQSAIASGPRLFPSGLPAAQLTFAGPDATPAPGDGARACRTAAPVDDARSAGPASERAACGIRAPLVPIRGFGGSLGPAARSAAGALAALFGGAGPHGPPVSTGTPTIPAAEPVSDHDLNLDLTLGLGPRAPSAPAPGLLAASPPLMPTAGPTA
jgi:hypothetical protein